MSYNNIESLAEALAGAFAEGVDLGPRAGHISAIGQNLTIMIDALRSKIAECDVCDRLGIEISDLDKLSRLVRAASDYNNNCSFQLLED